MTLGEKQELFSRLFTDFLVWCFSEGYEVRIGEVFRTEAQQKIYVEQGKSWTMDSKHRDKLAADLFFTKDGEYLSNSFEKLKPIGDYWETLHPCAKWGGNWRKRKDSPHFELDM